MVLHADRERDWWMFHDVPWQTPDSPSEDATGADPWMVPGGLRLTLEPLDETGFLARLASFDGGGSDTATLAYRDDAFVLLLTNGSP
ncbi:hypothetical protein ACFV2Q_38760 [Streptomyces sp. NPDC059650]|uniref:hypothetical protein n=1 Tax=Streptomyces sp. NPDC059650 TaxID=3346896 RepID=UPI0036A9D292